MTEEKQQTIEEGLDETMAEEAKPDPTEIVIREDADAFRRMALEDERQILEELQGRALDTMIYSFESGGRRQTGFSWKGTREAVRTLNARGWTKIRLHPEIEPRFEDTVDGDGEEAIRVTVYAEDAKNGGGNWGVAVQPKRMKRTSGEKVPDPFTVHKALSKAQRNAYEPLIPLEAVEYLKAQYLGRPDQVKVIPGAGHPIEVEPPKALDTPEAKDKVGRLRSIYDEIKQIDRLVMPPGQFNAIVMGAQHDLDRLDDAIAHLETFRDQEFEIAQARERYRHHVAREVFDREAGKVIGMNQQKRLARWTELADQVQEEK